MALRYQGSTRELEIINVGRSEHVSQLSFSLFVYFLYIYIFCLFVCFFLCLFYAF